MGVAFGTIPLIELLGPSGVGKTTVLAELFQEVTIRQRFLDWRSAEKLLPGTPLMENWTVIDSGDYFATLDVILRILSHPGCATARRLMALDFCKKSFITRYRLENSALPKRCCATAVIHDELVLHRAFSILPLSHSPQKDARDFFRTVPVPDKAIICIADPETLMNRISGRSVVPNCYRGLTSDALYHLLRDLLECCAIAHKELRSRGVDVEIVRFGEDLARSVSMIKSVACASTPSGWQGRESYHAFARVALRKDTQGHEDQAAALLRRNEQPARSSGFPEEAMLDELSEVMGGGGRTGAQRSADESFSYGFHAPLV